MSHSPKVSVCVITYNHELYIEACLDGILDQKTDFAFEVIVADDCSTDRTSEIVDRIAARDTRVRVLRPPRNIGVTQNLLALHNAARGRYVAHIDGDDLVLQGKLALQAAMLDTDASLSACGHQMQIVDETGKPNGLAYPQWAPARLDMGKAFRCGMPFFFSSLMYRREARTLTAADYAVYDWYFLTDLLSSGKAACIPEMLGQYRVHTQGLVGQQGSVLFGRLLELYERRLRESSMQKANAFAYAALSAVFVARSGGRLSSVHRRLLKQTFTPLALLPLIDAALWSIRNGKALAR